MSPLSSSAEHRASTSGGATRRSLPLQAREVLAESAATGTGAQNIAAAVALLGGPKVLRCASLELLDVHNAIVQGLPAATLVHLEKFAVHLSKAELGHALGVSERTIRRYIDQRSKRLSLALGSRLWCLAQLLARAAAVFGGLDRAQRWLSSSVMGLDGQRPIDLLQTSVGAQLVDEFLGRLEHGVYS